MKTKICFFFSLFIHLFGFVLLANNQARQSGRISLYYYWIFLMQPPYVVMVLHL